MEKMPEQEPLMRKHEVPKYDTWTQKKRRTFQPARKGKYRLKVLGRVKTQNTRFSPFCAATRYASAMVG